MKHSLLLFRPYCCKILFSKFVGSSQQGVKKYFSAEPKKIIVDHSKESFKAALVGMAVFNATSFSIFSSDSFKALVGDVAEKLKEKSKDL